MSRTVAAVTLAALLSVGCDARSRKPIVMQTAVETPAPAALAVPTTAPEPPDGGPSSAAAARALVDKAVHARAGDVTKLGRLRNQTFTLRGKTFVGEQSSEAECQVTVRLPGFGRWSLEMSMAGAKQAMTFGVQEDVGWIAQAGAAGDMSPIKMRDLQGDLLFYWVASLVPLTEPKAALVTVPNLSVSGKSLPGIKATLQGQPPVRLYFDPDSGLPVRALFNGTVGGQATLREFAFGEPRDFAGLKLPTHLMELHQGKTVFDWTVSDYTFPEKLEEKAFTRPVR